MASTMKAKSYTKIGKADVKSSSMTSVTIDYRRKVMESLLITNPGGLPLNPIDLNILIAKNMLKDLSKDMYQNILNMRKILKHPYVLIECNDINSPKMLFNKIGFSIAEPLNYCRYFLGGTHRNTKNYYTSDVAFFAMLTDENGYELVIPCEKCWIAEIKPIKIDAHTLCCFACDAKSTLKCDINDKCLSTFCSKKCMKDHECFIKLCATCHKTSCDDGSKLMLCSSCKSVSYCSKKCQIVGMRGTTEESHKVECEILKEIYDTWKGIERKTFGDMKFLDENKYINFDSLLKETKLSDVLLKSKEDIKSMTIPIVFGSELVVNDTLNNNLVIISKFLSHRTNSFHNLFHRLVDSRDYPVFSFDSTKKYLGLPLLTLEVENIYSTEMKFIKTGITVISTRRFFGLEDGIKELISNKKPNILMMAIIDKTNRTSLIMANPLSIIITGTEIKFKEKSESKKKVVIGDLDKGFFVRGISLGALKSSDESKVLSTAEDELD